MAKIALVAGFVAVVASIPSVTPSAGASDPWAELRRPLHIPQVARGSCPVTPARRVSKDFGVAQGSGPVYPVGGFPTLPFIYPPEPGQLWYGSKWSGQKVLWIASPAYRGPILIRGRQLDGRHVLRFEGGLHPARELRLGRVDSGSRAWRNMPSFTRLQAAGCYGWQVDGTRFSSVIVFKAVISS